MSDVDFTEAPEGTGPAAKKAKTTAKTSGGISKLSSSKKPTLNHEVVKRALDQGGSKEVEFEDDLAALNSKMKDVDLKSDDVLVARAIVGDRVQYRTRAEFAKKFPDKKLNDQVVVIKGEDGIGRTLPEVYWSIDTEGKKGAEAHTLRKAGFNREMTRVGLEDEGMKPYADREFLEKNDPRELYKTPGGSRPRGHLYEQKAIAGEQLPDVKFTHEGKRIGAYASTDPLLKGKSFEEVKTTYPDLELKSRNNTFSTPKALDDKYGKDTAEARFLGYSGKQLERNKNLPAVLVNVKGAYFSAKSILENRPDSNTAASLKGETRSDQLKALVLNKAKTYYMAPSVLKTMDPKHYDKIAKEHQLPDDFSKIKKDPNIGKLMLQTGKETFRFGDDPTVEKYRGKFKEAFNDTKVFPQTYNKFGKKSGMMGMLAVVDKEGNNITKDVAKDIGIEPRQGKFEKAQAERVKKEDVVSIDAMSARGSDRNRERSQSMDMT